MISQLNQKAREISNPLLKQAGSAAGYEAQTDSYNAHGVAIRVFGFSFFYHSIAAEIRLVRSLVYRVNFATDVCYTQDVRELQTLHAFGVQTTAVDLEKRESRERDRQLNA